MAPGLLEQAESAAKDFVAEKSDTKNMKTMLAITSLWFCR